MCLFATSLLDQVLKDSKLDELVLVDPEQLVARLQSRRYDFRGSSSTARRSNKSYQNFNIAVYKGKLGVYELGLKSRNLIVRVCSKLSHGLPVYHL